MLGRVQGRRRVRRRACRRPAPRAAQPAAPSAGVGDRIAAPPRRRFREGGGGGLGPPGESLGPKRVIPSLALRVFTRMRRTVAGELAGGWGSLGGVGVRRPKLANVAATAKLDNRGTAVQYRLAAARSRQTGYSPSDPPSVGILPPASDARHVRSTQGVRGPGARLS